MQTDTHSSPQNNTPIAILSWEMNPMVAGGSWTACYHFVRKIKKQGANPIVVTPWERGCVDADPFNCGVETATLGVLGQNEHSKLMASGYPHFQHSGPYGGSPYSAYWPGISSGYGNSSYYGGSYGNSGYGFFSGGAYSSQHRGHQYGGYGAASAEDESRVFFDFMRGASELYAERLLELAAHKRFELIHAQDWVTFEAAARAAKTFGVPWIAHFHSLERDRRPWSPDAEVERIEHLAARTADFIVTPSQFTARQVIAAYGVSAAKILVMPNVLSDVIMPPARGEFGTRKIVFLGRLELQKGPDRFASIASLVQERDMNITFSVFGDGALSEHLIRENPRIKMNGPLPWNQRWSALDGATALLVPSRAEPFGMVVLEAMQCGVPVLFSNEAGVAEVVLAGVAIQADDVRGTAEQVMHLLDNRKRWDQIARDERHEIRTYPKRNYENRLLNLYSQLSH